MGPPDTLVLSQVDWAIFYSSVALFYVVRIRLLTHQLDRPVTYQGEPGSTHWRTHQTFRFFRLLIFAICLIRVPYPQFDKVLVPIEFLWQPEILISGCMLLAMSFLGIIRVNLYLRQEWRSGARPGEPGRLITTGPYAYSQNPMMVLVILGQLGFFFALPSVFTAICLMVGVWAVIAQVQVERNQLASRFGEDYAAYSNEIPRWILR